MAAPEKIDFDACLRWAKSNCFKSSRGLCATYVKKAFEAGGCTYVSGDGYNNQSFCKINGFELIGEFCPKDNNPRNGPQFPNGYVQQAGDICLLQHSGLGHMCWSFGSTMDDWVSDYWQVPPQQQKGTGPYCYATGITKVQFWRHKSVLNGAPVLTESADGVYGGVGGSAGGIVYSGDRKIDVTKYSTIASASNTVQKLASASNTYKDIPRLDGLRRNEFNSLKEQMMSNTPTVGRTILVTDELYESHILKGSQEAKTFVQTKDNNKKS